MRSQDIANTLREKIQHGHYMSGDRFVELTLSQEYAVSQNTIRDALHIIEQEGWVHKIPRRGVYIPRFTIAQAQEIYALWETIERLALSWAIDNWTDTEKEVLHNILGLVERKINQQEWQAAHLTIYKLHNSLAHSQATFQTQTILSRLHNQAQIIGNQRTKVAPLTLDEWDIRIEHYVDVLHEVDQNNLDKANHYLSRAIAYEAELILPYID